VPRWLLPWLVPAALALGVMLATVSTLAAAIALNVIVFIAAPAARVRYLKRHPPSPELVKKPFWRF
jgi:hypothetical protein